MPYKMTKANKALDILCVTLPLNKHSNKRVSQQRGVMCIKPNRITKVWSHKRKKQ